jgi:AcrR family transcriptional regulator
LPTVARLTDDQHLLRAARDVFATHGYGAATLEAIAEAAGVSRVTLHRRGFTKERLLAGLAEAATVDYRDAMWPALTAAGSGADRLQRALVSLCASAERNLAVLIALQAHTDVIFHEEADTERLTRSVFTEPLERLLRDGAADGTLRPVDPQESATVLFNLVGWTYVHLRHGHRWAPDRARAAVLDVALNGLVIQG